jgi:1,4-dihydroxy-2-naphthoyl-CoA synthase
MENVKLENEKPDRFGICCVTDDKKEGTTAFLEKRSANFQGK